MTSLETVVLHPYNPAPVCPLGNGCHVCPCTICGRLRFEHPAKPACRVDLWTSNLRTLIEVYCSQHGLLGQVPFSDAVTLRDEHLSTGGAPVETGPDASPDTTRVRVSWGRQFYEPYSWGWECPACPQRASGWSFLWHAHTDARRHLREVHG